MKNHIIRLSLWLALCFAVVPCLAQSAFKGQLHISDESFSVQGSLLRVRMRVSYDDHLLNKGETLNFTPMLKSGFQHQALSSVVIVGKGVEQNRLRGNIPVVSANRHKQGSHGFEYDTTIPYAPWMDDASFYVESEERSRNGKGHVYEDMVFERLRIGRTPASSPETAVLATTPVQTSSIQTSPYNSSVQYPYSSMPQALPEWIQILEPTRLEDDGMVVRGTIPLADSRKIGNMGSRNFNEAVFHELREVLRDQLSVAGTRINTLSLTGYGAPIGNYRQNETRCTTRAMELKEYLLSRGDESPNSVNVSWVAEDWDSIRALTASSTFRLRDAALDIMRSVDVGAGREEQLMMLGGGTLYSNLVNTVFPQVCRIDYYISLRREPVGSAVNVERSVSLHGMYVTACNFEKGSREFNDIIDLSARLYPNYAEACINAAGVALMRGDLQRAEEYLKGLQTDSRAYNNIGVLHLLRGDASKAEVYLLMAEAAGVPEATAVLQSMRH